VEICELAEKASPFIAKILIKLSLQKEKGMFNPILKNSFA